VPAHGNHGAVTDFALAAGWVVFAERGQHRKLGRARRPPQRTAYAAAKAALIGATRVWALELATTGITVTVNAVAPGPIQTELSVYGLVTDDQPPLTRAGLLTLGPGTSAACGWCGWSGVR
jgi:NAD(P)-dependent dehydrogenase (short-subunit alcohol dehydrogenase family)